jgi:ArsR family transcriptional regulator
MNDLAQVFRALSDPSRLRILGLLLHAGELCVCDIERVMGCTQTKVSRHLAYLKRRGLVADRRQGLWMIYSIAGGTSRERKALIESLRELLRSYPIVRNDAKQLGRHVQRGCCATVALLKAAPSGRVTEFKRD